MIRDDGVEAFRVEVDCNGPVRRVTMTAVSRRLVAPDAPPFDLRDDGQGADLVAGDFIFTAGPFRHDTASPMPAFYLNDPTSPAGLDAVSVGTISIGEIDGTETQFLIGPRVGILRGDIPASPSTAALPPMVVARHLVNVRTESREVQRFLRSTGGDLRDLTAWLYRVLPDGIDFILFLSTCKVEMLPRNAPTNFNAGLHATVRVDFTGTGRGLFDDTASYGSRGRLLGLVALDAYERGLSSRTAAHELLHQWGAYVDPSLGLTNSAGPDDARSNAGSLLGGFARRDIDGSLVLDCGEGANGARYASPIDKYMMGLIDASRVGPLYVYSQASPAPLLRCGRGIDDIAATVTIEDIRRVHGPRVPGPAGAQRDFTVVFVAESHGRLLNPTEMTYYETFARHFGEPVAPGQPDPYVGYNWVPVERFFGEGTTWRTVVPRYFDHDVDGDVDLADFAFFQACFNGANRPYTGNGCQRFDRDGDGDVDLGDFAVFRTCFNGPNRPPACN